MRIAFVSANQEQLPEPVVPLGILSVMASTPRDHETRLWDLCFEEQPVDALREHLAHWQPDRSPYFFRLSCGALISTTATVTFPLSSVAVIVIV